MRSLPSTASASYFSCRNGDSWILKYALHWELNKDSLHHIQINTSNLDGSTLMTMSFGFGITWLVSPSRQFYLLYSIDTHYNATVTILTNTDLIVCCKVYKSKLHFSVYCNGTYCALHCIQHGGCYWYWVRCPVQCNVRRFHYNIPKSGGVYLSLLYHTVPVSSIYM